MISDQEWLADRAAEIEIEVTEAEEALYVLFAEKLGVSDERLLSCYIELVLYFDRLEIKDICSQTNQDKLDLMAEDLGISVDWLLRGYWILRYKLWKLNRVS